MNQRLQPHQVSRCSRTVAFHLVLATTLSLSALTGVALAQQPPPSTQTQVEATPLAEVVVTGSRIARSTFNTPNPVTVLNANDIQNLGITNVGEVLGELPQNSNFFAANNVGLGNFNVGAQLANLRGLNPFFGTRTLTLIDTQRVVSQATGGGVDVTLIPSMMVLRTETVTAGVTCGAAGAVSGGTTGEITDAAGCGVGVRA